MTEQQIQNKITNILSSQLDINITNFDENISDQLDSIDKIDLICEIEREFDININDSKIEELNTFDDLVKLIQEEL